MPGRESPLAPEAEWARLPDEREAAMPEEVREGELDAHHAFERHVDEFRGNIDQ